LNSDTLFSKIEILANTSLQFWTNEEKIFHLIKEFFT